MNELNNIQAQAAKQVKKLVFTYKNQVFSQLQNKNTLFQAFSIFHV